MFHSLLCKSRKNKFLLCNSNFPFSFSFHGLGPPCIIETLNKETYANFLQEYLMPYIAQHFDDGNVMLLHDNHTAHKSNFVKDWINENIGAVEDFVVPHPRFVCFLTKFI